MAINSRFAEGNGNWKNGVSKHPLRHRLYGARQRCYNKNDRAYKNYGARGITVCKEWRGDTWAYINYVESLLDAYKEGYTVDRINNDGNYEPGNMRWANMHIQTTNQRRFDDNTDNYAGIGWHKRDKKWTASIEVNRKTTYLGYYDSVKSALIARNNYIINNNLTEYKVQQFKEQII